MFLDYFHLISFTLLNNFPSRGTLNTESADNEVLRVPQGEAFFFFRIWQKAIVSPSRRLLKS